MLREEVEGSGCSHICAQRTQGEGGLGQAGVGGVGGALLDNVVSGLYPAAWPVSIYKGPRAGPHCRSPAGFLRTFYQRCWWTNILGKEWAIQRKQKKTGTKNENSQQERR